MKLFVTGASGFLGREIVRVAISRGHTVDALVRRRDGRGTTEFDASVTIVEGDLRRPGSWVEVMADSDVVVHAAAAPGGSRAIQLSNTVVATEQLLTALERNRPKRLVHVSSLSVYDYHALKVGGRLDESAPLEADPLSRDAYTEAKLVQERLVREWCITNDVPCVVVRPGAIVGQGRTWNHGAAFNVGSLAFIVSPRGRFRMVSLSNCAEAIVSAAELDSSGVETVNVVDDALPTHAEFFRQCRRAGLTNRTMVPVPWVVLRTTGRVIDMVGKNLLSGRLQVPELLDARRQDARWKPLEYGNDRAHTVLGWRSSQTISATVERLTVSRPPGSE